MQNQTLPLVSVSWFQRRLDAATAGRNLKLRVMWSPALQVPKAVPENGRPVIRLYAKYPLVGNDVVPHVRGIKFMRNVDGHMVMVGYEKAGGLAVGNILPTDIPDPDYEYVNYADHLFVVEWRLPDGYARAVHAKKRELADASLGFDPYGEFPAEGIWDFFMFISDHRDDCCKLAFASGIRCHGLYREPDGRDIEEVKRSLKQRDERPRRRDMNLQVSQAARDITQSLLDERKKNQAERMQMAREINRLAVAAIEKNSVYLKGESTK